MLAVRATILMVATIVAVTGAGCGASSPSGEQAGRQATVAARGATVMPFDLDRTLHDFQPLADGGLQVVTVRDPGDHAEVVAIRGHLREEARRFQRGDFADPAEIHGEDMPGLAVLQAGAGQMSIQFTEREDGAEIRYTTTDPVLVAALHDWFEAQTMDHGKHSVHR